MLRKETGEELNWDSKRGCERLSLQFLIA